MRRQQPTTQPLTPIDLEEEEDESDLETVQARFNPRELLAEPVTDPGVRMPVAFIGEVVMDDHTVQDDRPQAVSWREEAAAARRRQVHAKAEELVERLESVAEPKPPRAPAPAAAPAPPDAEPDLDRVMLGLGMLAVLAVALALAGLWFLAG